jgi:hypothetical protein
MKKIEEYFETLLTKQLAQLVKLVINKEITMTSIIVPKHSYEAIITILSKSVIKYRSYDVESFKIILMSLDEKYFNMIEEINNSTISKELKTYVINSIC